MLNLQENRTRFRNNSPLPTWRLDFSRWKNRAFVEIRVIAFLSEFVKIVFHDDDDDGTQQILEVHCKAKSPFDKYSVGCTNMLVWNSAFSSVCADTSGELIPYRVCIVGNGPLCISLVRLIHRVKPSIPR